MAKYCTSGGRRHLGRPVPRKMPPFALAKSRHCVPWSCQTLGIQKARFEAVKNGRVGHVHLSHKRIQQYLNTFVLFEHRRTVLTEKLYFIFLLSLHINFNVQQSLSMIPQLFVKHDSIIYQLLKALLAVRLQDHDASTHLRFGGPSHEGVLPGHSWRAVHTSWETS